MLRGMVDNNVLDPLTRDLGPLHQVRGIAHAAVERSTPGDKHSIGHAAEGPTLGHQQARLRVGQGGALSAFLDHRKSAGRTIARQRDCHDDVVLVAENASESILGRLAGFWRAAVAGEIRRRCRVTVAPAMVLGGGIVKGMCWWWITVRVVEDRDRARRVAVKCTWIDHIVEAKRWFITGRRKPWPDVRFAPYGDRPSDDHH